MNDQPVTIAVRLPAYLAEELRLTADAQRLTVPQLVGHIIAGASCDPSELESLEQAVTEINRGIPT